MVAPQGTVVHSLGTVVVGPASTAMSEQTRSMFSWSLGSIGDEGRENKCVKKVTMDKHHLLQEGLPDCLG